MMENVLAWVVVIVVCVVLAPLFISAVISILVLLLEGLVLTFMGILAVLMIPFYAGAAIWRLIRKGAIS